MDEASAFAAFAVMVGGADALPRAQLQLLLPSLMLLSLALLWLLQRAL